MKPLAARSMALSRSSLVVGAASRIRSMPRSANVLRSESDSSGGRLTMIAPSTPASAASAANAPSPMAITLFR